MATKETKITGVLSPVERFSEILFGLIMTLSITGTVSVVKGGREEVGTILLGVVGCNIAWGIIDAVLYLLGTVSEHGREYRLYNLVQQTRDLEKTRAAIVEVLPPQIAAVLLPEDLDAIRQRLANLPERPHRKVMTVQDLAGAGGVFLLVVLSCIPLIIPFFFIVDPLPALRLSNAVAILMLFVGGFFLAKYARLPKILTGTVMVVVGALMVGITVALGG